MAADDQNLRGRRIVRKLIRVSLYASIIVFVVFVTFAIRAAEWPTYTQIVTQMKVDAWNTLSWLGRYVDPEND